MSEEERDINLEGLFRDKLEENELTAHAGLTDRVMNHLERKEFLRFNPSRFNIFYTVATAAAGITVAGLLLFSSPEPKETALPIVEERQQTEQTADDDFKENSLNDQLQPAAPEVKGESSIVALPVTPQAEANKRDDEITRPNDGGKDPTLTKETRTTGTGTAVQAGLKAVIKTSVTSGCVPLTVSFSHPDEGPCKTEWNFGDGGVSDENATDYIFDVPGTYNVKLTLTDEKGRRSSAATVVEVWPLPTAEFEIHKNELPGTGDQVLFTNLSAGAVRYLWSFGDGATSTDFAPEHLYQSFGRYDVRLTAYSEYGCADSLTITDAFTDQGMFLRFPNVFMPNPGGPTGGYYNQRTDEDNQVFHPVTAGVASFNIKIYNKTGLLVFESDDIEMGWDGYYKGQICSPGVYVWKVRATYRNGKPIVMAGDVTLINY